MEPAPTRDQEVAVLGASFPDAPSAIAATEDLGRLGLGADDVRTAVWTDGRFVTTEHAGGHIWRSIGRSAGLGTVLGTVLVTALSFVIWPGSPVSLLLIIGASFGGTVGVILGGYHGLNQKRDELWYESDWRRLDRCRRNHPGGVPAEGPLRGGGWGGRQTRRSHTVPTGDGVVRDSGFGWRSSVEPSGPLGRCSSDPDRSRAVLLSGDDPGIPRSPDTPARRRRDPSSTTTR